MFKIIESNLYPILKYCYFSCNGPFKTQSPFINASECSALVTDIGVIDIVSKTGFKSEENTF